MMVVEMVAVGLVCIPEQFSVSESSIIEYPFLIVRVIMRMGKSYEY